MAECPEDIRFNPLALGEIQGAADVALSSLQQLSMVRPRPVSLKAENVNYAVSVATGGHKKQKVLLDGISLKVSAGQLMAIVAPSGAGKSTLLNLLAGRASSSSSAGSKLTGSVLVNGEKRSMREFRRQSAYVLQDTLLSTLTVFETIAFAALLKLPRSMPQHQKMQKVNDLIVELGLLKCQDSYIGDHFLKGISGGEKRRVCIGIELVTDPSLIFLDEPTTGLDSFNAQNVVFTLMKLAKANRTVICTIHQPRSQVYQMFDLLLLLSEGKQMYFGAASEAVGYFEQIGFRCPSGFNPADYLIDLISYNSRTQQQEKATRRRIEYISQKFKEHYSATQKLQASADDARAEKASSSPQINNFISHKEPERSDEQSAGWMRQLRLLTGRAWKISLRNTRSNRILLVQTIIFGLLLALIWLKAGNLSDGADATAVSGVLIFLLVNQSFSAAVSAIFVFPTECAVLQKERASRSYQMGPYYLAKTISEFPKHLLAALLFSVLTYFLISLRSGAQYFFAYLLIILLARLTAEGLEHIISALAVDENQAAAVTAVFIFVPMLFSGFVISTARIPVWLRWLKWISYLRYAYMAIMQNEYDGMSLGLNCGSGASSYCPTSGLDVLEFYDANEVPFYGSILGLLGMLLLYRFITYLVLRFLKKPKTTNVL